MSVKVILCRIGVIFYKLWGHFLLGHPVPRSCSWRSDHM